MPMKSYIPNPVQATQYKVGDNAQAAELQKSLGLTFQVDQQQYTDAQGNTGAIADGDYVGVSPEGTTRMYNKDYFERTFTELAATAVKK